MHVALLHQLSTDLDDVLFELDTIAGLPVTVTADGVTIEALAEAGVPIPKSITWGRTGWSAPWFPMLPDTEADRQLVREAAAISSLGLEPGPLHLVGPWDSTLPSALTRNGVEAVLIPLAVVGRPGTGVVAHLDAVVPCVSVVAPDALVEALDDPTLTDDLVVVEAGDVEELQSVANTAIDRAGCDLTTVATFLTDHRPGGRVHPRSEDWERRLERAEVHIHHRKLVRLMTRVPDRISDETEQSILTAQAGAAFAGEMAIPHHALIEARRAIDDDRRRGQDWGKVTRLDWDADGRDEVHVELPDISMVVAPHRSAAVPTIDLKRPVWPISALSTEPGWELVRYVAGSERVPADIVFEVESFAETKTGEVAITMDGILGQGSIRVNVEAGNGAVQIGYELSDIDPGLLGPGLRLRFGDARSRSDGSSWTPVDEPRATAGHRIRIEDGEHRASIESLSPIRCFLRPAEDGVIAWPHWDAGRGGTYRLTIHLQ